MELGRDDKRGLGGAGHDDIDDFAVIWTAVLLVLSVGIG